jgi:hypothetical protein
VLCEVTPVFAKVLADLSAAKEAADIAMGLRKSKAMEAALAAKQRKKEREEKRKQRQLARLAAEAGADEDGDGTGGDEAAEKALADKLLAEQKRALDAIARAAEREKAWFMAHPHKFIRHAGEAAFCIVCREKETEFWMKTQKEQELAWRESFDTHLQESVDAQEQTCKDEIEGQLRDRLMQQASELVGEEMAQEERQKAEAANPFNRLEKSMKGLKLSPLKMFQAATGKGAAPAPTPASPGAGNGDGDEEELAWPRELSRITAVIRGAGLSLVDARGKSILPKRPPKKAAVVMYIPPSIQEDPEDPSAAESMGLRVRVWHRDGEGNRANFLGSVTFSEKVMIFLLLHNIFVHSCSCAVPVIFSSTGGH